MRYVEVAPGEVRVVEGPPGVVGDGQARVEVGACGLCASDHRLLQAMVLPKGVTYPVRPGHEVAGVVTEVGPGTVGIAPGDAVVLHPLAPCGHCKACLSGHEQRCPHGRVLGLHDPGGMAEEVVWPVSRMVAVPGLPAHLAALLPDAVATAHHALGIASLQSHGRLCVIGAGGVGSHVVELAMALHPHLHVAAVVRSEASVRRLQRLGVHAISGLDGAGARLREEVGRFDAVIDFSGVARAPAEAVRMLGSGGRLVLGSVVDEPLDLGTTVTAITTRELQVIGCYVSTLADLRAVAGMALRGRLELDAKVSFRVPLDDAPRAFALLDERPPGMVRVVLEP